MKYKIVGLLVGLCFSITGFTANIGASKNQILTFKTVQQARKYCPNVNSIKFTPGQPALGVFRKIAYLTGTFSSNKGGFLFMNNGALGTCQIGTHKPHAYSTQEDRIQAKKAGATICNLIVAPAVSKDNAIIKNVEFTRIKGNYGSRDKSVIHCNYKYQGGKIDPDTAKPIEGLLVLTSQPIQTQKQDPQKTLQQTMQIPLNQPNMKSVALLVWANEAAVSVFSYDFVTYRKSLQDASDYFTPDGWKAFMKSLKESRNLERVKSKKLVVSAVATGAPIILSQGIKGKKYTWTVQIPILVTYQSATELKNQNLVVTILISRTQKNIGKRGVGIVQFIGTPKK